MKRMEKQQTIEPVELENTRELDVQRLDVTEYIGTKAKIDRIQEMQGQYGYFVKIDTSILAEIGQGDNSIKLRASKLFNLIQDQDGNIGWGKDSKLASFLKKMEVGHYKDLAGKLVIVQSQTKKDGNEYLTF